MKEFEAWITMPSGQIIKDFVRANNEGEAYRLLQSRHGKDAVKHYPVPTKNNG